jgi:hypothetical protein
MLIVSEKKSKQRLSKPQSKRIPQNKENQMLINPQLQVNKVKNLQSMTQHLRSNLAAIQPKNSEMSQLITYTLIGAGIVGIMVYHYIKQQEET